MHNIIFNLLKDSGFEANLTATDDYGDNHKIEFRNQICNGEIHTSLKDGVVYIKAIYS